MLAGLFYGPPLLCTFANEPTRALLAFAGTPEKKKKDPKKSERKKIADIVVDWRVLESEGGETKREEKREKREEKSAKPSRGGKADEKEDGREKEKAQPSWVAELAFRQVLRV